MTDTKTEAKLESRVGELHTIHDGIIPHVSQLEAQLIAREGDATIAELEKSLAATELKLSETQQSEAHFQLLLEQAEKRADASDEEARMAKERVARLVEANRELKANERRRTALDELATDAPRDGEG